MDDEQMILDVGKAMLEKLGYHTLIAGSGKDALNIYQQNKATIDLVVLDLIMPEMSGDKTYRHLKEIHPKIKVLFSSGYSRDGFSSDIWEKGSHGFIQKPFDIEDLAKKILEVLKA